MSIPVSFSRGLALFLAECCLQAYNQLNFKSIFSIPEGYTLIEPIVAAPLKILDFHSTLDCYDFIIESPDSIVVSFRGSRTNPDWIADASIKQTYFPYTRIKLGIHSGFAEVYKACRQRIIDTLNKLGSSKRLYITDHSLGGALAVLCALDTAVNTAFNDPVMYNFGSPSTEEISEAPKSRLESIPFLIYHCICHVHNIKPLHKIKMTHKGKLVLSPFMGLITIVL